MSQKIVQFIIGQLLTDDELRHRFVEHPRETLTALRDQGLELTQNEIDALVKTDRKLWNSAAKRIHPHLQRCSLHSERTLKF